MVAVWRVVDVDGGSPGRERLDQIRLSDMQVVWLAESFETSL